MDVHDLSTILAFDAESAARHTLAEGTKLWSEVILLQQNQETPTMRDPDAEALFLVLAGEVVIFEGRSHKRLRQWQSVITAPGAKVIVRSASVEPSAVLVVTAPPPSGLSDEA